MLAQAEDAAGVAAGDLLPQGKSLVIVFVNSKIQTVFGQGQPFFTSEELPGKADGVAFKIIAKAEVAHHFKESMMSGCAAYGVKVVMFTAGTDAALGRSRAAVRPFVNTQEHVLELDHSGISEQ